MSLDIETLNKIITDEQMPVEIEPLNDDEFLIVKETLTRIGYIKPTQKNTLFQTCHILHKKGKYYITHFKHMYMLDGKIQSTNLTELDIARNKYIAKLLQDWGLLKIVNPDSIKISWNYQIDMKVLKHVELKEWNLQPRFFNIYKENNEGIK